MAQLFAGTSGFAYAAWKPDFYPKNVASKNFLQYYSTRLNAVEINYTFRQLPKASTLEGWVSQVIDRPEFLFACKAHQRITHFNRLKESEFNELFFKALEPLRVARKLGPVLFQLPPNMKLDLDLLSAFLAKLPDDIRTAFEFRNPTWLVDEVYKLLEKHRVALCLAESEKLEVPKVITSDFVYARLRKEEYTEADRQELASQVKQQLGRGLDVFAFFKHEDTPDGALYAEELLAANERK
jgi:uncharacterized protein YecE (DUF72 family)